MSTLKIIHDNAVDRAVTLTASSTASVSTSVLNLKNDSKSKFHRSTTTSVTFNVGWSTPQTVGGVGLPAHNMTPSGKWRVRGYDASSNLVMDSGLQDAAPGPVLVNWDWNGPLNGNAFSYGGAAKSAIWFDQHYAVSSLVIDLEDPTNPAGYIDTARLVAGGYWQTTYNPDYGADVGIPDMTENYRSDAGNNDSDRGPMYDTMNLQLSYMPEQDRARMMQIMRSNGIYKNMFISVLSDVDDPLAEQDWIIYGKRQNSNVNYSAFRAHSFPISIEGW